MPYRKWRRPHQPLGRDRGRQKRQGPPPHGRGPAVGELLPHSGVKVPVSRDSTTYWQPFPNVPCVQPAVFVQSFRCLCWVLQVAFEYIWPFHTHLREKRSGSGLGWGPWRGAVRRRTLPRREAPAWWLALTPRGGDLRLVQRGAPESLHRKEKTIFSLSFCTCVR